MEHQREKIIEVLKKYSIKIMGVITESHFEAIADELLGGQDGGQDGGQESKEPDQSDYKKGYDEGFELARLMRISELAQFKEQPTPPPPPQVPHKGAEEILKKHPKEFLKEYLGVTVMPKARIKLYANDIALLMQEYAEQYHKERTREELIKFASYNFKEALRVDYDIERIAEYVDDYLTK